MIRYLLSERIHLMTASRCEHPLLRRLAGRGPWQASETADGVCLQRGDAPAWGPVLPGLHGLRYQLADPLPVLPPRVPQVGNGHVAMVDLPGGVRAPVALAVYAPVAIGLDGQPQGPADAFGRSAGRLWDRMQADDLPVVDPELIAFCRLALMAATDLTPELIHAHGLITTASVPAIWEAANGLPKAAPGGGG